MVARVDRHGWTRTRRERSRGLASVTVAVVGVAVVRAAAGRAVVGAAFAGAVVRTGARLAVTILGAGRTLAELGAPQLGVGPSWRAVVELALAP